MELRERIQAIVDYIDRTIGYGNGTEPNAYTIRKHLKDALDGKDPLCMKN